MTPIEITHENRVLRGMAYGNPDADPVLLAHGFSGSRIGSGRLFVDFARALVAVGHYVISFDRAGHGESDGDFFDTSVPDEISQLSAMTDFVDAPLHVVGHSLGGMELATLAARRPEKIRSLTLWAAAAASVDQAKRGLIQGQSIDALRRGEPFDFNGQALGPAFIEGMKGYDPYAGFEAYTGPVHLHHGAQDQVVDPSYSERYDKIWPQARLKIYDAADHGWQNLTARRSLIETCVAQIKAC